MINPKISKTYPKPTPCEHWINLPNCLDTFCSSHEPCEFYTALPIQRGEQPPRDHLLLEKPEHTGCLGELLQSRRCSAHDFTQDAHLHENTDMKSCCLSAMLSYSHLCIEHMLTENMYSIQTQAWTFSWLPMFLIECSITSSQEMMLMLIRFNLQIQQH